MSLQNQFEHQALDSNSCVDFSLKGGIAVYLSTLLPANGDPTK